MHDAIQVFADEKQDHTELKQIRNNTQYHMSKFLKDEICDISEQIIEVEHDIQKLTKITRQLLKLANNNQQLDDQNEQIDFNARYNVQVDP